MIKGNSNFVATATFLNFFDDSIYYSYKDKEGPIPERASSEFTSLFTPPLRFIISKNSDNMQETIWKDVEGFEGLYMISNTGLLKSMCSGKIMTPWINERGYCTVILRKDGGFKNYKLHRLVAKAFIPNPENKATVNHKNCIKTDNTVENLEWATNLENMRHSFRYGSHKNVIEHLRSYRCKPRIFIK